MFRPLPFYIAFRYIYGQKFDGFARFVARLSMIGIMLGSLGLILVMSVMNGLENKMQESVLQFMPQVQITTQHERLDPTDYPKQSFTDLNGVVEVVPFVSSEAILQSTNSIAVATIMGIDPNQFEPIKNHISWGDLATLKEGEYHVVIGQHLSDQLGLFIGDKVRVMVTDASQITPVGRIPSQRLFTVSGIFSVNRDIEQSLIYLNINDAAKLLRYPNNMITSWRLFVKNPLNIDTIINQIQQRDDTKQLQVNDWRSKRGELFQAIKMEKNIMGLLISLITIVAAFNIISSLGLLVMEKQSEIAILKTQGLTNSKIMAIFVIQGASSGIIGTVVGCGLGILLATNLNALMNIFGLSINGIILPSLINPSQVVITFVLLLFLSLLATFYPAYRAAKIAPATALRYE